MAEDVVTHVVADYKWVVKTYATQIPSMLEAAEEIKRLRAEVTRWKELAADLAMQCAINEMAGGDA